MLFGLLTFQNALVFVAGAVCAVAFPKVASLASAVLAKLKSVGSGSSNPPSANT